MESFSSRKHNFVSLPNPVQVCSWIRVSADFDCLITGHQGGTIGLTWLPTPTSTDSPHSTTLVYTNLKTITHIATTSQHNDVAFIESNGNLLLLRINGPRTGIEKLATLVSGAVEMVLGVTWSRSSSSLATLRYTHTGNTLSLRVYSGMNADGSQVSTVTIILPKTMTGDGVIEETANKQQRVAWGKEEGGEIIISLTNNTIILVSTQTWQVISQVKLPYSPRIFTASEGAIFALNNDNNLCFKKVDGQLTHFKHLSVDTCTWVSSIEMLIAAARDSSKQMMLFINKEGYIESTHHINTTSPVLDIAWRDGSDSIVYSTKEGLFSLLFYQGVPSLYELASWSIEDTSKLPMRMRSEVQLRQSVLFYPQHLMDTLELDVYSCCKPVSLNSKRKVVQLSKDYLGQQLHIFHLKQPKFLHKKQFKLDSFPNRYPTFSQLLLKLLPESIVSPPSDTCVIPGKNGGSYEIIRQNESLRVTFKDNRILIRHRGKLVRGEVRNEDVKRIAILVEGEESAQIIGSSPYFRLVLLHKPYLALLDLLLISLVFILHIY